MSAKPIGPVVVSLPVADRRLASAFYRQFLDQVPPGEPQDDGEPNRSSSSSTRASG